MTETIDLRRVKEEDYVGKLEKIKEALLEMRRKRERQWYINENFDRGFHFVWWKKVNGTIDRVTVPKGLALRCVPKASRQGEAIISQICGAQLTVTTQPIGEGDSSINDARNITNWLRQEEIELDLDTDVYIEVGHSAFKNGYAMAEVGFDEEKDDLYVQDWDALDTIIPLNIKKFRQTPIIIKTVVKDIADLKDNSHYKNTEDLKPDPVWSGSEMKNRLTTERLGAAPEAVPRALVDEYHILVKNKDDKIGVMIVTICQHKLLSVVKPEDTSLRLLPWALLKFKPGPLDGPSWLERFISMNKSFDILVSNIENFAQLFWKGRVWKQKGTTISPKITTLMGAVYEYEGMAPPKTEDLPGLPAALFTHMANQERWMEEQGLSSIYSGRVPRGVRAAKMMESMKQADMSNLGVPLLFYQAFRTELYEKMIDCAAANYVDIKEFVGPTGNTEPTEQGTFKVVGEDAAATMTDEELEGVTVIRRDYKIKIELQPQIGFTQEGRLETIKEIIPVLTTAPEPVQQLILKELGVSNISKFVAGLKMAGKTSIIDTPEFQLITKNKPELAKALLEYLQTPEAQGQNPLSFIDGEKNMKAMPQGGQPNAVNQGG